MKSPPKNQIKKPARTIDTQPAQTHLYATPSQRKTNELSCLGIFWIHRRYSRRNPGWWVNHLQRWQRKHFLLGTLISCRCSSIGASKDLLQRKMPHWCAQAETQQYHDSPSAVTVQVTHLLSYIFSYVQFKLYTHSLNSDTLSLPVLHT